MRPTHDCDEMDRLKPVRDVDRFDDDGGHYTAERLPGDSRAVSLLSDGRDAPALEILRIISIGLVVSSGRQRKSWDDDKAAFDAILEQSELLVGLVAGELRPLASAMWNHGRGRSPLFLRPVAN